MKSLQKPIKHLTPIYSLFEVVKWNFQTVCAPIWPSLPEHRAWSTGWFIWMYFCIQESDLKGLSIDPETFIMDASAEGNQGHILLKKWNSRRFHNFWSPGWTSNGDHIVLNSLKKDINKSPSLIDFNRYHNIWVCNVASISDSQVVSFYLVKSPLFRAVMYLSLWNKKQLKIHTLTSQNNQTINLPKNMWQVKEAETFPLYLLFCVCWFLFS